MKRLWGMTPAQVGILAVLAGLNISILGGLFLIVLQLNDSAPASASVAAVSSEAASPQFSTEPPASSTPPATPTATASPTRSIGCSIQAADYRDKIDPFLLDYANTSVEFNRATFEERKPLIDKFQAISDAISEVHAADCVKPAAELFISGLNHSISGFKMEQSDNDYSALQADRLLWELALGETEQRSAVAQLIALSNNLVTPTPQFTPTSIYRKPTSAPTPVQGLTSEIDEFAYKVAFVSREYGGQYILVDTLRIVSRVNIPITQDFYDQDISYAVCLNYKYSAVQFDGSRVDDVRRAMLIYIQNGVMRHSKYLDRETC